MLKQFSDLFRGLFEALSDEYVMKSFYAIYSKPQRYTFEKEVLAKECDIPDDKIDVVMEKLKFIATSREVTINGEKRTVYTSNQRHELIAALVLLTEFFYAISGMAGYTLQVCRRSKSYFS